MTVRSASRDIRRVETFESLSPEAVDRVALVADVEVVRRGTLITMTGERSGNVYAILDGHARLALVNPQGRQQVLSDLGPGQLFNLAAAFGHVETDLGTTTMMTDGRLLRIPFHGVRSLAQEGWETRDALMRHLADEVRSLVGLAQDLALRTIRERLARFILELRKAPSRSRWTQQEIAERVGTVREVVNRGMRALDRDGLIEIHRHQIVVLDEDGLRREAGE